MVGGGAGTAGVFGQVPCEFGTVRAIVYDFALAGCVTGGHIVRAPFGGQVDHSFGLCAIGAVIQHGIVVCGGGQGGVGSVLYGGVVAIELQRVGHLLYLYAAQGETVAGRLRVEGHRHAELGHGALHLHGVVLPGLWRPRAGHGEVVLSLLFGDKALFVGDTFGNGFDAGLVRHAREVGRGVCHEAHFCRLRVYAHGDGAAFAVRSGGDVSLAVGRGIGILLYQFLVVVVSHHVTAGIELDDPYVVDAVLVHASEAAHHDLFGAVGHQGDACQAVDRVGVAGGQVFLCAPR